MRGEPPSTATRLATGDRHMKIKGNFEPTIVVGKDEEGRPTAFIIGNSGTSIGQVNGRDRLRWCLFKMIQMGTLDFRQYNKLNGQVSNLKELPERAPELAKVELKLEPCICGDHDDYVGVLTSTDGDELAIVSSKKHGKALVEEMYDKGYIASRSGKARMLRDLSHSRLPEVSSKDPGNGRADASLLAALLGSMLGGGVPESMFANMH